MSRLPLLLLAALVMLESAAVAAARNPTRRGVVFYVSPSGNDAWSGRLAAPNRARTDGPFATPERARDAVRALHTGPGGASAPVTVLLRGGIYFLSRPLVFAPQDSGTEQAPVTYAAYRSEVPVISGGRRLSGWKVQRVDGREVWTLQLPEVAAGRWSFRELWVGDVRRPRARYPKHGYLSVDAVPDVTPQTSWEQGQRSFRAKEKDLDGIRFGADAEVTLMSRWVESHLPVTGYAAGDRLLRFSRQSQYQIEPGDLYYVENAESTLDAPGDWRVEAKTGTLSYLPMRGETPAKTRVVAPVLTQVVRLEGHPERSEWVQGLRFAGLTFSHTGWWFPSSGPDSERSSFGQAAIGVPSAVYGDGVRDCNWERCRFTNLGTYALELARGCSGNRITRCEFTHLGAGGIKIGERQMRDAEPEQTHGTEVSDCTLRDLGQRFHSAIGIWVGQSYENRVRHNEISDLYYSAISDGWTWGYERTLARGNRFEANHIHHVGRRSDGDGPILSDMGGIYTLGTQPGTVIRGNRFHDVAAVKYGGWGIYLDEGSTQILVENNVVYNTTHGGFHQHYGKENTIRNNIFAFGRDAQIQATRPEDHLRFTFENNIVYWKDGPLTAGSFDDLHFRFADNVYWRVSGGELRFGDMTWEAWRAKGMDAGSTIADPQLAAPEQGVFDLRPGSPALQTGFHPFDTSGAGPRPEN